MVRFSFKKRDLEVGVRCVWSLAETNGWVKTSRNVTWVTRKFFRRHIKGKRATNEAKNTPLFWMGGESIKNRSSKCRDRPLPVGEWAQELVESWSDVCGWIWQDGRHDAQGRTEIQVKATCLNVHNLKGEILKWKLKERGVPVVQTSQNKDVKLGALYSMDCQQ